MKPLLRWLILIVFAGVALQVYFVGRIALMALVDPQSTAFQRSEAWRLANAPTRMRWSQQWIAYSAISDHLKRAAIASEDDAFASHDGVDWDALEKAWQKNAKAEEQAAKRLKSTAPKARPGVAAKVKPPKIVGGSTITQQLSKNLFLSGERNLLRKGQELVLTFALERLLSKQRILEIYLNSVEWGEGVFGAEAAAQHYFRKPASSLTAFEAARLAVMLPRPKYFEKIPNSGYLAARAETIVARMSGAELP
jgi:monofunctional biosynthetic peptidoglycan transglycosylase